MEKSEEMSPLEKLVMGELDKLEPEERTKQLRSLIELLQFHLRFAELTSEELAHLEGELSPKAIQRIRRAKPGPEREELFEMYSRTNYFRQCAWMKYLNGQTPDKPFTSKPISEKPAAA